MNKKTQVAFGTLIISFIVLFLKTKAYYATNSIGVMSDALETVVNVVTALITLFAVKIATQPADEEHPYGHGKLEYFSASFEGGLIFFAALAVIFQALKSFWVGHELQNISAGNIYLIIATAFNLVTGLFLINFGNKQNSEALKASGKHIMSDVVTTFGVLLGLVLAQWTQIVWIDSLVGLLMGCYLLYEGFKILKNTSNALMDATDLESVQLLAEVFNKNKSDVIIDIHNIKIIRSGNFHHIDVHVVVPEFLDVATAHQLTHDFENRVVRDYKYEGEVAFHLDPCQKAFCKQCDLKDCKIRHAPFEQIKIMNKDNLIKGPQYTN